MTIAVFARLNVDFIYSHIERLPEPGEEIFSRGFEIQLGGGAAVIPILLSQFGIKTKLGTFLSDDMQSYIARMLLEKLGFQDYVNFHRKECFLFLSPTFGSTTCKFFHFLSRCISDS